MVNACGLGTGAGPEPAGTWLGLALGEGCRRAEVAAAARGGTRGVGATVAIGLLVGEAEGKRGAAWIPGALCGATAGAAVGRGVGGGVARAVCAACCPLTVGTGDGVDMSDRPVE